MNTRLSAADKEGLIYSQADMLPIYVVGRNLTCLIALLRPCESLCVRDIFVLSNFDMMFGMGI